jgi:hypothetical protein
VGGDGFEYYVLLRSPLLDHDLDLANDYDGLGVAAVLSPAGQAISRFPIGAPLCWAPSFLVTHAALKVLRLFGSELPADGFARPYQATVCVTTYALVLLALALLETALRARHGRAIALFATLALWLASPLDYYATANPSMSHGVQAALGIGFALAWLRARDAESPGAWGLVGLCGGLLAIVRLQDAVLLALPGIDLLLRGRRGLRPLAALAIGPALFASLQLAVLLRLYGLGFPAAIRSQSWLSPETHVLDVLFSARHGLFTWTPLFALAGFGFLRWLRDRPLLAVLAVSGVLLSALVNSTMQDWWASEAFGQRRMLGLCGLFGLGLAESLAFLERRPRLLLAGGLLGLVLWNSQFAFIFNSQLLAPRGQSVSLDRLAAMQVELAYRRIAAYEPLLPDQLWLLLYENLRGVWLDEGGRSLDGRLDLGDDSPDVAGLLGRGWYKAQTEGGVSFRRSRGTWSTLRLPVRTPGVFDVRVRLRAELEGVVATVHLNGVKLEDLRPGPGWSEAAFGIPTGVLRPGFNELGFGYSRTPRRDEPEREGKDAAVAIESIVFRRLQVPDGPR